MINLEGVESVGIVVDDLEGKYSCISFGKYIDKVKQNPSDIDAWFELSHRAFIYGARDSLTDPELGARWFKESYSILLKARKANPENLDLLRSLKEYNEIINPFGYFVPR